MEKQHSNIRGFHVGPRYVPVRCLGNGTFGLVYNCTDTTTNTQVAIKQVRFVTQQERNYRLLLREILILQHLHGYPNVLRLVDVFSDSTMETPDGGDTFYLVTELFDTDLQRVNDSQVLSEEHVRWILFQILHAVQCCHKAGILHRDIKPANILMNENCEVRLCDFGLARPSRTAQGDPPSSTLSAPIATRMEDALSGMTNYVVSRWYRAPELLMEETKYDTGIDVWSVGCILGELLKRSALFVGHDHIDQLTCILSLVGSPTAEDLSTMGSLQAQEFVAQLDRHETSLTTWCSHFPRHTNPLVIDLLMKMLSFSPRNRIDIEGCFNHPWFRPYVLLRKWEVPPPFELGFDIDQLTLAETKEKINAILLKRGRGGMSDAPNPPHV